jgi:ribose-phosphate pyrophosphokinase
VLVSPDAGAYKKIFDVAKEFGIQNIITANKVRDLKTGNIIRTEIPTLDQHKDLKYVIIDDIGDGFGTFVELAKVIKDSRPTAKIYLVVTHSIQEGGINKALDYFNGVFTTNSIRDWDINGLDVFNVF